ncbi:DUF1573 domain-containing protein [Rufibacter quisquiliarum]|uniref:DUF1573 domain-containing protein n=1 Tax=Rufibacter quisquiliarum TaxID=1549639 RepID=A0A839GG07_9BACT|nr:DUF1573 domain-containing protein [Rufibacter quisquiliarum]MBA9077480.1 hypothetical protein [Rufibacter quisquiliarum]
MKKFIGAALFLFGAGSTMAQSTPPPSAAVPSRSDSSTVSTPVVPAGPSIVFEEQKFDFGDIRQGEVVQHTFRFTNNGSQPLVISNVRTTCGCTATDYPKKPVMPGETASITARFNSAGKRGQQNKVITIDSNALQGSTQVLIITKVTAAN